MIAAHGDKAAARALSEARRLAATGEAQAAKDWERLYQAIGHILRKSN